MKTQVTLLKSVLDVGFCKMLIELPNGMQVTMKRQFCRFWDSDGAIWNVWLGYLSI